MLHNYNFFRILSIFLDNPTKGFGWRELSEKSKLGAPSVKRYLEDMKKEHLVVEKKVAGRTFYFPNREGRKYKIYKTFEILLGIEECGLLDEINRTYGYPTIILFGSYARGEALEESDIDIAIITESKKDMDVKKFENSLRGVIQIFKLSRNDIKSLKKSNPSTFNGIINGYVISGMLELD